MRTVCPKVDVFCQMYQIQHFCCFITQLVKKPQHWSLYVVIKDILPLLSYEQISFGCFQFNTEYQLFQKTPKTVMFTTHQQNIAQRRFVFNISSIYLRIIDVDYNCIHYGITLMFKTWILGTTFSICVSLSPYHPFFYTTCSLFYLFL